MVNKFSVQVSHGAETNNFVCSTRREFLSKVFHSYNIRTTEMVLIDKKTLKEITVNDLNDQMHVEIRRQPRINGQQVSEVATPIKVPVKDDIVSKLKENRVLTGLERQFLVKLLDDHYDDYENPTSVKRKRNHEDEAPQTANKKVQVSPDLLNTLRSYQTQTDELKKYVPDVCKPSTSKDLIYESKRLALEEKRNPEKVNKIMTDTFDSRRNFILMENPVIKLVREKYPLLFSLSEVRNELNRIFYVGKDVEFLLNVEKYTDAVLGLVDEDDPLLKTVNEKVESLITPVQKKYAKEVGALLMISNLLHEKRVFLSTEDEPCCSSSSFKYPRIEASCKAKKLFHDLQMYRIIVEEQLLCEASDFKEAVLCLLASFFIFNISYPPKAFNTLVVMEKVFLEANDTDLNEIDVQTQQIIKLIQLKTNVKV